MSKKNKNKKNKTPKKNKRMQLQLSSKNMNTRVVAAPVFKTKVVKNRGLGGRGFRVQHSELINDMVCPGTTNFDVTSIEVNPGLTTAFPWLAGIAPRFETYRFVSLVFEYIPSVGTDTPGRILLAPDYDPDDVDTAEGKLTLSSYDDSKSFPPWDQSKLVCKTKNLNARKGLLVRTGSVTEKLLYDALQLNVCYSGFTAEKTLGELWVHYTVDFYTPQLDPVAVINLEDAAYTSTNNWPGDNPFQAWIVQTGFDIVKKGVLESDFYTTTIAGIPKPYNDIINITIYGVVNTLATGMGEAFLGGGSPEGSWVHSMFGMFNATQFSTVVQMFAPSGTNWKNPVYLAWTGLQGAVMIGSLVATYTLISMDAQPVPALSGKMKRGSKRRQIARKKKLASFRAVFKKYKNQDKDADEKDLQLRTWIEGGYYWAVGKQKSIANVKDMLVTKGTYVVVSETPNTLCLMCEDDKALRKVISKLTVNKFLSLKDSKLDSQTTSGKYKTQL